MLLCLDIGNTTIGCALVENEQIIKTWHLETNPATDVVTYHQNMKENIIQPLDAVIISSVVPSINPVIQAFFEQIYSIKPYFISVQDKSDMEIQLANPLELGADLLADVVGARLYPDENILVVDLGTATKFLVIKNNTFLGGAIAPGVVTSLNNLFRKAELLDDIVLAKPSMLIGNSTITCLQSGSIIGTACMIDAMAARIAEEVGPLKIIITGGIAPKIIPEVKVECTGDPNLIFKGLIKLYQLNCL